jgi:hypothetical protein
MSPSPSLGKLTQQKKSVNSLRHYEMGFLLLTVFIWGRTSLGAGWKTAVIPGCRAA